MSSTPEVFKFTDEFKASLYAKHMSFVQLCERLEFYEEAATEHQLRMASFDLDNVNADDVESYFENKNDDPWTAKLHEVMGKLPDNPGCIEEYLSTQACVIELAIEDMLGVDPDTLPSLYAIEVELLNISLSDYVMRTCAAQGQVQPMVSGTVEDFVADLACVTAFASPSIALVDAIEMTEAALTLGLLQIAEQEKQSE